MQEDVRTKKLTPKTCENCVNAYVNVTQALCNNCYNGSKWQPLPTKLKEE